MDSAAPTPSPSFATGLPATVLPALLQLLPNGVVYYLPVYAPDGLAVADFRFAYLNTAAQHMLGLPEQPTTTYLELFPSSVASGAFAFHCDTWQAGGATRTLEQFYQADGYDKAIRARACRVEAGLLVSFTDTEDQPRTFVEIALRASQATEQAAAAEAEAQRQRFYQVLMQLPAQVAVYRGPDHVYQFVNPRYQRFFPNHSFTGRPLREAIPEVGELGLFEAFDRVYQTGEPTYTHEIEGWFDFYGTGEREQLFVNSYLHPLRDALGRIDGVLDFSYNVTEQVRARRQVEQLNQELETRVQTRTHELHEQQALLATTNQELLSTNQALHKSNQRLLRTNADLDTFVYTASHDLKSPLTNLEGLLAALRDTLPVEVQQQPLIGPLLRLLDDTVSRFRLTIEQLTELIQLQQTPAGPARLVLLGPLVRAVQQDLLAETTASQAHVHVAIDEGLAVSFAPANLRSIVYNLLSNALKYRDPERPAEVWVRATPQPGAVVLTVQDNGLGLSKSQQQRLFQVFQRLHTHVEGTGVGLYMIKRLIENAGAIISVHSELGVGSAFSVSFPV